MSSQDRRRVTTAAVFLPVGRRRPIWSSAPTRRSPMLFSSAPARSASRCWTAPSSKRGWVVLCAGVYGSPDEILMRSGVGPAEHLRSLGFPFGSICPAFCWNLADHAGVDIDCGSSRSGSCRPDPAPHCHLSQLRLAASDEAPDIMLWLSDPRGDPPIFEIDIVLLRPRARGTVRLRSRDPAKPPLIELPDRCDPIDIERLAEGYLRGLDVATHPGIRSLCSAPPSPSARQSAELRDVIRADAYHLPHVGRHLLDGPVARRWRGRRRLGSSARHRRRQRGRCLDRSQRSIGVHAPPDGHARRASRRAACRWPLTKSAVRCGGHPRGERARRCEWRFRRRRQAPAGSKQAALEAAAPGQTRPRRSLRPGARVAPLAARRARAPGVTGRPCICKAKQLPQVGERHLPVIRWSSARPCLGGDRLQDGQPRRAPRRGFCPD